MVIRMTGLFVWAVMVMMYGDFSSHSFAAEEDQALALSKALSQVKIFSALTNMERDALKDVATLRNGREGQRIIEQGKALDRMFIILEGQANVLINGKHVVTLSGQSLVGEIEFLDRLPACADVFLINNTAVIELNNSLLIDLMEKQPRLGYVLMREIARIAGKRLRETNTK